MLRRVSGLIRRLLKSRYEKEFNTPVRFWRGHWYVNERLVELAFVHQHLDTECDGKRALEFGCTKSELALQLASLGYEVDALDLREYGFDHPNLTFIQENLLNLDERESYDLVTAVSVLEHVGLGAYGENEDEKDLERVLEQLVNLLKPGGRLLATVPVGIAYRDSFFRSFEPERFVELFDPYPMELEVKRFFKRIDRRYWLPADQSEVAGVSNLPGDRRPTGVNAVGCFAWKKLH